MIRVRVTAGKTEKVLLGLTERNIELIRDSKPLLIAQDSELRLGADLVLFYGKDEIDCIRILEAEGLLPPDSDKRAEETMDAGGGEVDVASSEP